jgi:hypothetical protein
LVIKEIISNVIGWLRCAMSSGSLWLLIRS